MTFPKRYAFILAILLMPTISPPAHAQEAPDSLKGYFDSGSSHISDSQLESLDQAARLLREGSPIVMILAGGADTVGRPEKNLQLSLRRANAVADGLVARGIPVERLQVLGRGNSELPVDTGERIDERENRVVKIKWR
jgi:outer membrane protein OmpA-like peptidoglycan-associated protein